MVILNFSQYITHRWKGHTSLHNHAAVALDFGVIFQKKYFIRPLKSVQIYRMFYLKKMALTAVHENGTTRYNCNTIKTFYIKKNWPVWGYFIKVYFSVNNEFIPFFSTLLLYLTGLRILQYYLSYWYNCVGEYMCI